MCCPIPRVVNDIEAVTALPVNNLEYGSLGSNALVQVDVGDADHLETLQATLRAGLTRLVTTLRAVAPRNLVIIMTTVPRVGLYIVGLFRG